ncbi:MAG: glutathione S-transferase family protein [Pseudomonadota bacterium]
MTPSTPITDLILHHYPRSPFSEKIRLILGNKKLAWKSVVIPAIMPKPDVLTLTGGYRKTPFLQVGADIYCDSALICDVLEHVQPEPPLYPPHLKGVSRVFAQWADSTLFWAAMAYNLQPKGAAHVFGNAPPEVGKAFGEDRKAMSANMTRLRAGDATSAYRSYLRRIAHMAEEHDFLFGIEPCVADFAAYHALWYTRVQVKPLADILNATPAVLEWMDRMAAIGHGRLEAFDSQSAITVANKTEPLPPGANLLIDSAFQDDHGIPLGSRVTITAESFGPEPTEGTLIAATRTHYTLRREGPLTGSVHVHFPRVGYVLRAVEAAN